VNDVILAAISLGFRAFLHGRGEDVTDGVLTTMVPVSTRTADAPGEIGNQVTAFFADLPVGVADPLDVVARVSAQLRGLKQSGSAISVNMMIKAADFVPSSLFALGARLSARAPQRSVSTVTTNVPGPQWPIYLIGRQLLEMFPYIPIAYGLRITMGIFSYDGQITMGITGDADAVDDVDQLAAAIEDGLAALRDAAAAKVASAKPPTTAARARRRTTRAPAS
jgi:WS/DGAT/MGAT family acyltransferase